MGALREKRGAPSNRSEATGGGDGPAGTHRRPVAPQERRSLWAMEPSIQHVAAVADKGPVPGGSQPKRYVECDDRNIYVAKGAANPEGSREFFNELLAANLAVL